MAPSVAKSRFQNSLDMVAARSMRDDGRTAQSGTGNAWCIVDSPTLGRMSSLSKRPQIKPTEGPVASSSRLAVQAANVAPLNIKKIRRRGLVSGVQLALPPSPLPSPASNSSALSTPDTTLAFTAEWDLTQRAFVITPLDSSYPQSATSSHTVGTPVPVSVDEEFLPTSPAFSSPLVYSPSLLNRHPDLPSHPRSSLQRSQVSVIDLTSEDDADYSPSTADTPVSSIFDRQSVYSHGRNLSHSTTASSIFDLEAEHEKSSNIPRADVFEKELPRISPNPIYEPSLSEQLCTEHDPLEAPIDTSQEVRESTGVDSQLLRQETGWHPQEQIASFRRPQKPLPDVPRGPSGDFSFGGAFQLDTSMTRMSFRRQLSSQISRAFTGTALFKRSVAEPGQY